MASDYERIGGGPAVSAVVDALYDRLTAVLEQMQKPYSTCWNTSPRTE